MMLLDVCAFGLSALAGIEVQVPRQSRVETVQQEAVGAEGGGWGS